MTNNLQNLIDSNGGYAILDGAIATQLEERGYPLIKSMWSSMLVRDHPEAVEQLHYDYFVAGADIGTSCSYQASFEGFKNYGIEEEEASLIIQKSVHIVRSARNRFYEDYCNGNFGSTTRQKPLVAASGN